jgi:hypothetical protein
MFDEVADSSTRNDSTAEDAKNAEKEERREKREKEEAKPITVSLRFLCVLRVLCGSRTE